MKNDVKPGKVNPMVRHTLEFQDYEINILKEALNSLFLKCYSQKKQRKIRQIKFIQKSIDRQITPNAELGNNEMESNGKLKSKYESLS